MKTHNQETYDVIICGNSVLAHQNRRVRKDSLSPVVSFLAIYILFRTTEPMSTKLKQTTLVVNGNLRVFKFVLL